MEHNDDLNFTSEIANLVAIKEAIFLDSMMLFCSINNLIDSPRELSFKHLDTPDSLIRLEVWKGESFFGSFRAYFKTDHSLGYDYKVPPTFALIRE